MTNQRERAVVGLKKAQSLISTMINMVENKEYCIDIMQQNLAAIGLLKSAHHSFLEDHLSSCFANAMASKNEKKKQKMVDEILRVSKLAAK